MITLPGRIPLRISPFFFLTAAFIGWIYSQSLVGTLLWIGVIFVSILFHECGHAYAAKSMGLTPRIELTPFGGLTIHDGRKLSKWKEFVIVLAGPLFGFTLFLLATYLLALKLSDNPIYQMILVSTAFINLVWTVLNLVPVLPLDGGQLLRIICEGIFGRKGLKIALIAGITIASLIAFGFLIFGALLPGAFFFLFAFQNIQLLRQASFLSESDEDEKFQAEFSTVETLLSEERYDQALPILENLRGKTKEGLIFTLSTQYMAHIYHRKGDLSKVYELLHSIYKDISPLELILLQEAADKAGDYAIVEKISPECFKLFPSPEVALRAAKGAAHVKDAQGAIGWLFAAHRAGVQNIHEFIQDPVFDGVRDESVFIEGLQKIERK